MREIKFRAWLHGGGDPRVNGRMIDSFPNMVLFWKNIESWDLAADLMQYTGLKDKNGVEIYEGDILRIRRPARDKQSHYGENIPGPTNTYTEPLEPMVEEFITPVEWDQNSLSIGIYNDRSNEPDGLGLLGWEEITYTLDDAKEGFIGGWFDRYDGIAKWDDEEEGDLQYLLDAYNLSTEEELIKYLGIEVIGNIHENPELLDREGVEV